MTSYRNKISTLELVEGVRQPRAGNDETEKASKIKDKLTEHITHITIKLNQVPTVQVPQHCCLDSPYFSLQWLATTQLHQAAVHLLPTHGGVLAE